MTNLKDLEESGSHLLVVICRHIHEGVEMDHVCSLFIIITEK